MSFDPQPIRFTNADGLVLHGDVVWPAGAEMAVVIAHPHPQFGGNRFNPVVGALFAAIAEAGAAALRFDFRGVGSSEGSFDDGEGEGRDIAAALDHLEQLAAEHRDTGESAPATSPKPLRLALAGYSFGADVSLGLDDARPNAVLAVAPPLAIGGAERFAERSDPPSVRLITGSNDQFRNAEAATQVVSGWPQTTVHPIDGADHFFGTGLAEVADEARLWATSLR